MELIVGLLIALVVCWAIVAACMVTSRVKHPVHAGKHWVEVEDVVPQDVPLPDTDHRFGPVADSFDGLWERWICRECAQEHVRRRPGL